MSAETSVEHRHRHGEGAIPGHIYTEKVGKAALNYSMIIDGIPWRLGAAYGAVTVSRGAGQRD